MATCFLLLRFFFFSSSFRMLHVAHTKRKKEKTTKKKKTKGKHTLTLCLPYNYKLLTFWFSVFSFRIPILLHRKEHYGSTDCMACLIAHRIASVSISFFSFFLFLSFYVVNRSLFIFYFSMEK